MLIKRLRDYLDGQNVRYLVINHRPAFTAQQVAAATHVSGNELAKSVVVKLDGTMALVVVPASCHVDLHALKDTTGATDVMLATEREFMDAFPDCEVGAMPPFGNIYQMPVYADERLSDDQVIAFNAGTHTDVIQMAYQDFERLVQPILLTCAAEPI